MPKTGIPLTEVAKEPLDALAKQFATGKALRQQVDQLRQRVADLDAEKQALEEEKARLEARCNDLLSATNERSGDANNNAPKRSATLFQSK